MNNSRMWQSYWERACRYLEESKEALNKEWWPEAVRRAQECIELSVKAVLRALGAEFPKEHDISNVLRKLKMDIPAWFKEVIPEICDSMEDITDKRGPAMYGDEQRMIPADELFGKEAAEDSYKSALFVFEKCKRFLKEWL